MMRIVLFLAAIGICGLTGCANQPALKQPSDPFTITNPDLLAATAMAVYACEKQGYDTAKVESRDGPKVTFVCAGVYPAELGGKLE